MYPWEALLIHTHGDGQAQEVGVVHLRVAVSFEEDFHSRPWQWPNFSADSANCQKHIRKEQTEVDFTQNDIFFDRGDRLWEVVKQKEGTR